MSLEVYFNNVLNMSQEEKFHALKEYLDKNSFNYEKYAMISNTFEKVFNFLNDRSKWKELQTIQENLIKYNSENRKNSENSRKNTFQNANSINSNPSKSHTEPGINNTKEEKKKEYSKSTIKESDELKVFVYS